MPVHRCPQCSLIYLDSEVERGVCPGCDAPLGPPPEPPPRDVPPPTPPAAPRRGAPFLLGLLTGCLIGPAALWGALRLGAPLPGGDEQGEALRAALARRTEADERAREAEAARAEAAKALGAANRRAEDALKQKGDTERRLQGALARLAEERGQRAALEKTLAEAKKLRLNPERSFVRDWQLLGPFASTADQGHDTVYPPEREPVQLKKPYDGFGGQVRWRPHRSAEDKIDLAAFFNYRAAGAAYAVSWVHSDTDQAVTLGVGSDDGIRLWVNGKKAHDVKGGRQARAGQDVVKSRLKMGWNEVLVKVDNITGTWEFYLEFRAADGRQPLKVFSISSPPPGKGG